MKYLLIPAILLLTGCGICRNVPDRINENNDPPHTTIIQTPWDLSCHNHGTVFGISTTF